MIIRNIEQIKGTERDVKFTGGNSLRLILESDNMGFAFMKTIIPKGEPNHWHYPNHLEACFCLAGKGILTNLDTNEQHEIGVDTIYILDKHDDHTFQALEDTILISVFNPPLSGKESHDENGHYQLSKTANRSLAEKIVKSLECCKNDYDAIDTVQTILNTI